MRFSSQLISTLALGATVALASACGDSNDDTADGGVINNPDATVDSLYNRLGQNAGIASAVDAIVIAEVQEPDIAAFFTQAAMYEGAPTVDQIKACLVLQLGAASGGPEVYPGTVAGGFTCRSMADAHAHLGIGAAVFDKFVMIAANTLTSAGVSAADVATVGGVLNSTKADIAIGPTLYQRLGGHAGITGAVDAVVAAEVMDAEIAAFFVDQGDPNHKPTVDQIKLCLVAQLGSASGGPEQYPTMVAGGFTCRSMADAHSALPSISSAVFDKFVMIAANTLTGAGVAADDVAIVGSVLNGTKNDIVH